jgi:hypothetical protein
MADRVLGRRRRRRAAGFVIVVAAAAAASAALIVSVAPRPPTLSGRVTSSWEPARPLAGGAHPAVDAPSGTWRLVTDLVARGWKQNTVGPEPGWLACPTAATCYVRLLAARRARRGHPGRARFWGIS